MEEISTLDVYRTVQYVLYSMMYKFGGKLTFLKENADLLLSTKPNFVTKSLEIQYIQYFKNTGLSTYFYWGVCIVYFVEKILLNNVS